MCIVMNAKRSKDSKIYTSFSEEFSSPWTIVIYGQIGNVF